MKITGTLFIFCGFLALVAIPISGSVDAQEKTTVPKAKDKEEFIDYEALLNDRLGKGITPEKNVVVLLWKVLGPTPEGGDGMPPAFFKWLGIEEPPKNGEYYIGLDSYMKNHTKLAPEAFQDIWNQQGYASKRPWEEKDYPHIAGWLKANEKPLSLVIEACKRPDYYSPLVSRNGDNEFGSLTGVLMPAVQKCRELTAALTARAMLSTHEGKNDAAWRDLLACHRLGRQVARGGTLIETLVGIAIDQVAINADLAYLEGAGLPSNTILNCLKDLQALPSMPSIADKIDITERITYLQVIQSIRRNPGATTEKLTEEERKAWGTVDWEPAIKSANQWYDRIVAAMRLKDRAAREKEIDKINKELDAVIKEAKLLRLKDEPAKTVGKSISNTLLGLLMPALCKFTATHDRALQNERNLHVAFALAAYKRDQGRYPAKLADLSPKYLATVPDDLFFGKALIYRPSDTGYLFYSVGVNGMDEDGRWRDDDPPGDDLRVKIPLPPLKK